MPQNRAVKKGHHTNRHENGLVGPGKRVSKQKSAGQLNGNAKPTATSEDAVPSSSSSQFADREGNSTSTGIDPEPLQGSSFNAEELRWRKRGSESSSDGQDQKWETMTGCVPNTQGRRPDVANKTSSAQTSSAVQIATTILTSNPAGDTISLLIVLLALPSMILTLIQALFASLTLMPPSGGVSPVSFLSPFDVFQGSAGSPSFGTMIVVDAICIGLWFTLWTWAQNFALDLAQIQIAITLGSGNAGKSSSVNTICFLLVLMIHSARSQGLRQFVSTKFIPASILSHPRIAPFAQYLPAESDFGDSPGPPSKITNLFAIHIISQALMAFVRRRVAGTSTSARGRRSEPDISNSALGLDTSAQDSAFNTAASTGLESVTPPTPTVKEMKDKTITAKKRRRQANQVRSRQPFWAALASTKVHVLREVEQNKDKAMTISNSEGVSTNEMAECVWITNVEPATIYFEAGHRIPGEQGYNTSSSSGLKPCYVRINNARWHSVNMDFLEEDICDDDFPSRWSGSIGGLAPDCNYICSFRKIDGDEEIASIMVRTPPLVDRDQVNTTAPVPTRQSARPNSPHTTLKTSIQTAERSRDDANNRRNTVRRKHRNALAKLDREVETLQNKLKSGSSDDRLKQKLLQAERNARQHEDAISSISVQLDELETIPEEETVEYDHKRAAYDESNRQLTDANTSLTSAKSETDGELNSAKAELATNTTRKERLVARNSKLVAEQERLTQASIQNMSEKERKALESATREEEQRRQTENWHRRINDMNAQLQSVRMQTETVFREIEDAMARTNDGLLTPEGEIPGTHVSGPRNYVFGNMQPSTFIPDPQASPFLSYATVGSSNVRRPRSGTNQSLGALSGTSGDFDDADPIPPMPMTMDYDGPLNGRKSSGSSRGKDNHSPAAAGVIGSALRSPHKGSGSPGHMQSTYTW